MRWKPDAFCPRHAVQLWFLSALLSSMWVIRYCFSRIATEPPTSKNTHTLEFCSQKLSCFKHATFCSFPRICVSSDISANLVCYPKQFGLKTGQSSELKETGLYMYPVDETAVLSYLQHTRGTALKQRSSNSQENGSSNDRYWLAVSVETLLS